LSHALLDTTDYYDRDTLTNAGQDAFMALRSVNNNRANIPTEFGNLRGVNVFVENLVREQLGLRERTTYVHSQLSRQSAVNDDEVQRVQRFLRGFGLDNELMKFDARVAEIKRR
jgi:hypothetical protein